MVSVNAHAAVYTYILKYAIIIVNGHTCSVASTQNSVQGIN